MVKNWWRSIWNSFCLLWPIGKTVFPYSVIEISLFDSILIVSYFKEFWFNFFQNSHYCSRVCVIVMKSWNNFRKATMFGYFDNSCTVRPWKICPQNLKTLQICGWLNLFHYFWISWKPEDFFSIFSENLWISQSAVFCLDRMSV